MRLFRRRDADPAPDWFALAVGDRIAAGRRGRATVAALARWDVTVESADEGDGRRVALLWLERDGAVDALMVDHDIYGGDDAFDVQTLHDLEPADPAAFAGLTGRMALGEEVGVTAPDGREVVGDPEPIALVRAAGPHAGGVPSSGWVVNLFRADDTDVMRFWLVLCDRGQTPRLAFAARSRRARGATW